VPADLFGRPLRNLRLSVTDRCNLRCEYCMPEENYAWLPRGDLLHYGEIRALVDVFISLGVDKVRITGGEPLLRRELPRFVAMLASRPGLADLALTTNGVLLADQGEALLAAGLPRITVSLDTLRPDRFESLTRTNALGAVREGLATAARLWSARPGGLKIDTVVVRGVNDDELDALLEYGRSLNAEVRFIEYMDVGGASRWTPAQVVSREEILGALSARYGAIEPIGERSSAPAERFRLPDGAAFGIIASTSAPFCRDCDRSRLTADGMWFTCLYAATGLDLRGPFRGGASPEALRTLIADAWTRRADRGAEQRLALGDRRAFVPVQSIRRDPHLEMHTRGG
jgi:cyclic pyranopterin phosphate synthase